MNHHASPAPGKWIGAYYRRLPVKTEAYNRVHLEMHIAFLRDKERMSRLEEELALQMEAELERIG
jgi:hypothetical protein